LRAENPFFGIFLNGMAPVVSVTPEEGVRLEEDAETRCYFLDWERCAKDERETIGRIAAAMRGGTAEEFLRMMDDNGARMPIRASQVTAVVNGIFEKREVA
jgi:hypothetical protein